MLKRVAVNSGDEEARLRLKHQSLLQDFLELQKEFVSDEKKLQKTKEKRDILRDEVRFLRQRKRYLRDIQSDNLNPEQAPLPPQSSSLQNEEVEKLLITEKLPKNGIINGKRMKKKISWQDQSVIMKV